MGGVSRLITHTQFLSDSMSLGALRLRTTAGMSGQIGSRFISSYLIKALISCGMRMSGTSIAPVLEFGTSAETEEVQCR